MLRRLTLFPLLVAAFSATALVPGITVGQSRAHRLARTAQGDCSMVPRAERPDRLRTALKRTSYPWRRDPQRHIAQLLRRHGFIMAVQPTFPATLSVRWSQGGKTVATATHYYDHRHPGVFDITIRLTPRGTRLLRNANRVSLIDSASWRFDHPVCGVARVTMRVPFAVVR